MDLEAEISLGSLFMVYVSEYRPNAGIPRVGQLVAALPDNLSNPGWLSGPSDEDEPRVIFQASSARMEIPEPDANSHGTWPMKSRRRK
jgi:hypothetical protein